MFFSDAGSVKQPLPGALLPPVSPTKPSPKSWKSVKISRYSVGKVSKLSDIVLEKCIFLRLFLIKQHFFYRGIKDPQRCVAEA